MGTLTKDRPKPLINVGGRSLLDHALALADLSEIGAKVINIHYRAEMIRAHLAGQEVLFSDETDGLLETGGGCRLGHGCGGLRRVGPNLRSLGAHKTWINLMIFCILLSSENLLLRISSK